MRGVLARGRCLAARLSCCAAAPTPLAWSPAVSAARPRWLSSSSPTKRRAAPAAANPAAAAAAATAAAAAAGPGPLVGPRVIVSDDDGSAFAAPRYEVRLTAADSRHLLHVRRMRVGDRFIVIRGGAHHQCVIEAVQAPPRSASGGRAGKRSAAAPAADSIVVGRLLYSQAAGGASTSGSEAEGAAGGGGGGVGEPRHVHITLFQGIAKGSKMSEIIEHGTEIGVSAFVPLVTARTVALRGARHHHHTDSGGGGVGGEAETEEDGDGPVARWRKIAREATKQCRRTRVPHVWPVTTWQAAVTNTAAFAPHQQPFDLVLLPWEESDSLAAPAGSAKAATAAAATTPSSVSLQKLLQQLAHSHAKRSVSSDGGGGGVGAEPLRVAILIGPEGGLTRDEVRAAVTHEQCRARVVSLGPRILRTETAGFVTATAVLFHFADLS